MLKSDSWEHLTRIKGDDTNYPRPSCNYGRRDILVVLKEVGPGGGCDELMTEDFCSIKAFHLILFFSLHIRPCIFYSYTTWSFLYVLLALSYICGKWLLLTPINHFQKLFHVLNEELDPLFFHSLSCFTRLSLKILNLCEGCLMLSWSVWFAEVVINILVLRTVVVIVIRWAVCWKFCILCRVWCFLLWRESKGFGLLMDVILGVLL